MQYVAMILKRFCEINWNCSNKQLNGSIKQQPENILYQSLFSLKNL